MRFPAAPFFSSQSLAHIADCKVVQPKGALIGIRARRQHVPPLVTA